MRTVSHRLENGATPVDFKLQHYPASPELARDKREAARNSGRPLPLWAQEDPSAKIWFYHRKSDLDAAIAGPLLRSRGGKELLIGSRGVVDSAR